MLQPLQLLFDIPLADAKSMLRSHIAAASDLLLDPLPDAEASSMTVLKGGLGLTLTWSAVEPALKGYRTLFLSAEPARTSAVLSVGLGSHVRGGARVPLIAMELLSLGARIAGLLPTTAIVWAPGRLVSDPGFFIENVTAYAQGGVFPVLPTIDLEDGGDGRVCSQGLAWFSGQEIEVVGCDLPRGDLMRRAVRLVHDIATNGPVMLAQQVPDIDADKRVWLAPEAGGARLVCTVQPDSIAAHALQ